MCVHQLGGTTAVLGSAVAGRCMRPLLGWLVSESQRDVLVVQTVQLVCPPGLQPGQLMQFQAPSGQMLQIPLPAGVAPGQAFHVQIPG